MARPFFTGERFRVISQNYSNFHLLSSDPSVMSVNDKDITAMSEGNSAIIVYDSATNQQIASFNVSCISYQAPPSHKSGLGQRHKKLSVKDSFYLVKLLNNFRAPSPAAPELLEIIPDLFYKTRYLIVEVFDHWSSDGASITEMVFRDKNNNIIPYVANHVYDSYALGTPSNWDSEVWGKFNLYDGEQDYLDATTGAISSTLFMPGSPSLAGNFTRFLLDLGSEYDDMTLELAAGSPEGRIPKIINFYAIEEGTVFDYSVHLATRTEFGLAHIGEIKLYPRNTNVNVFTMNISAPRAEAPAGQPPIPAGLFTEEGSGSGWSTTQRGELVPLALPEDIAPVYDTGSGNGITSGTITIVSPTPEEWSDVMPQGFGRKTQQWTNLLDVPISGSGSGTASFTSPEPISEIRFVPTTAPAPGKSWNIIRIGFSDVGRTATTNPVEPADEVFIGYGVADYGLGGYGL